MNQLIVDSAVATLGTSRVQGDFAVDFPDLVNYVVRLTDDLDAGPTIAIASYRRLLARHRNPEAGISRSGLFKVAAELSRQCVKPSRFFGKPRPQPEVLDGFPPPETRRALRRDTVQRALAALPFDARALVLLRDFAHFTYDDLAAISGISSRKLIRALDQARAELLEIYAYIKF